MERLTGKAPGLPPVPATFAMDFVLSMDDKTYKAFMGMVARLYEYEETGLTPEQIAVIKPLLFTAIPIKRMLELAKADRENRVEILPLPGDVLYETDPAHGVVKHTVTDVHWVANTSAVDDAGMAWADYYTEEDIETAHQTREAAEAVLAAGSIMEGYHGI